MSTITLKVIKHILLNQRGATAIEYGLIAALISIAIITGLTMTGNELGNNFNSVGNNF